MAGVTKFNLEPAGKRTMMFNLKTERQVRCDLTHRARPGLKNLVFNRIVFAPVVCALWH